MDPKTGEITWYEWLLKNSWFDQHITATYDENGNFKDALITSWIEDEQKEIIDRETPVINEKYWYSLVHWILHWTIADFDSPHAWVNDTKLYTYYLYALITTLQIQCLIVSKELESSSLIDRLKNTQVNWKEALDSLKDRNIKCYQRLLIYESILKTTLGVQYNEKQFNIIVSKFPTTNNLTDDQINTIRVKILDPIFYGVFKNVFTGPYSVVICNETQQNCRNETLDKFPYPESDQKNPIRSQPDCLVPTILFNQISYNKAQAFAYLKQTISSLDWVFEKVTGVKAFWTIKAGAEAEKLANTLAGAMSEINKKLKAAYNFGAGAIQSASNAGELIKPVLILGGVALGLTLINRLID